MIEWKNTDPRYELVDLERAKIIIVRPIQDGHHEVSIGVCEMEYSWHIHTDFYGYETVGDKWNEEWYWTLFNNPYDQNKEIK